MSDNLPGTLITKRIWPFCLKSLVILISILTVNANSTEDSKVNPDQPSTKEVAYTLSQTSPLTQIVALSFMKPLPYDVHLNVISMLPKVDQSQWRLVSKQYNDSMDLFFFGPAHDPNARVISYSSENSGGMIGDHILNLLKTAQHRVIIASDKCTNEELLDDLLALNGRVDNPLEIRIVTGEDKNTDELLKQEKYASIVWQSIAKNNGKMHNKFIIIDDRLVITGSPNLTYAAYKFNIESFVAIYHGFIGRLYSRYYEYIVSGKNKYDATQDEYQRVGKMMSVLNKAQNNPIKVCLAPILNIKTFIINELKSSQIIDINMFLVSRATEPDNDIIDNLLRVAREEAKVTIKVDEGQYKKQGYVRRSLKPLVELGQTVYTVSKNPEEDWPTRTKVIKKTQPQFHDKIILIQQKDKIKKVFIGSAGFTDHVQDNLNLENMVLLYIPGIYDFLLEHFNAINDSRLNVTKL